MREQVRQRNPQAFQEKIEKQTSTQGAITNRLHKRGCHCKKSHCKKKYCECFQACLWRSSGRLLAQLLCWSCHTAAAYRMPTGVQQDCMPARRRG